MEIEAIALDDIFNIYSLNSKFSESILNLYNMLKLYQGTSWKYKIRGFICRKQAVTDNCLDVLFRIFQIASLHQIMWDIFLIKRTF